MSDGQQMGLIEPLKFGWTAHGQVPAKSNQYRIIEPKKARAFMAKTKEMKEFEGNFIDQIPHEHKNLQISNQVKITLRVWFRSRSSDLDNAAKGILDCLQLAKVITNDNRVTKLHMHKEIDPEHPRVEIEIEELY